MPSQLGKYKILRTLGKGAYSKVKLALNEEDHKFYAVKYHQCDDSTFTSEKQKVILNEISIIKQLRNENIIKLIEYRDQDVLYKLNGSTKNIQYIIIEEYANKGELFSYIKKLGHLTENIARYILIQIVHGLQYIQKQGFTHRDIKLENVLFDNDFNIKLIDFGFSTNINNKPYKYLNNFIGTIGYMAPEILEYKPYLGEKVDVFALGVCLFIMVSGNPPFNHAKVDDYYYKFIHQKKWNLFWRLHSRNKPNKSEFYSEEFKHLIELMLSYNSDQRLDLEDVMIHPWIINQNIDKNQTIEELEKRFQFIYKEEINFINSQKLIQFKSNKQSQRQNSINLIQKLENLNIETKLQQKYQQTDEKLNDHSQQYLTDEGNQNK